MFYVSLSISFPPFLVTLKTWLAVSPLPFTKRCVRGNFLSCFVLLWLLCDVPNDCSVVSPTDSSVVSLLIPLCCPTLIPLWRLCGAPAGCLDDPSSHEPTMWQFDPHYPSTQQTVSCDNLPLWHFFTWFLLDTFVMTDPLLNEQSHEIFNKFLGLENLKIDAFYWALILCF